MAQEPELMVVHGMPGQAVTLEDVNDLLADDDVEKYQEVAGDQRQA